MTTTIVDDKGRRRRGRVHNPDVADEGSTPEATPATDNPEEPAEKPKTSRGSKSKSTSPSKTGSKAGAGTKKTSTRGSGAKKEAPVPSPEKKKSTTKAARTSVVNYDPIEIESPVEDIPSLSGSASMFGSLIDAVIATYEKDPSKWTPINPKGRKTNSVQAGAQGAAADKGYKLETRVRNNEAGEERVFVRIKEKIKS